MAQTHLTPHSDACPGCASAPEVAFARHDHAHCSDDVLTRAEAFCRPRTPG